MCLQTEKKSYSYYFLTFEVQRYSLCCLCLWASTYPTYPSEKALKLRYRRPPTYPACCFLCKWCCEFKHLFILNPNFIFSDINLVIFWQQGQQRNRGMPVAESVFDPSSQPHTWVMMAVLVALSFCTPSLSLRTPRMNAVIDGQWKHPCLICLQAFKEIILWAVVLSCKDEQWRRLHGGFCTSLIAYVW